jgi:chemotaxis protein methyltransferase CheR
VPIVEYNLSNHEFERLQGLVRQHTGIELSESKRQLVYSRFSSRLRALGLNTFREYCDLVDDGNHPELNEFASAITTNFTRFFREPHHFEFLQDLVRSHASTRRLRIWSAGCSTGEEPYSIAMTLLDSISDASAWDIKILATDLDNNALQIASNAIYPSGHVKGVEPQVLRRWFQKGRGQREGKVRIASAARQLVRFRELNLIGEWPMTHKFDVIFCRNVMIYFAQELKEPLIRQFSDLQQGGSHLIVGHAESLVSSGSLYTPIGNTIYQRN